MTELSAWLDYRVRWRTAEAQPGRHGSRRTGHFGALRGYRPFWQVPDARAIDVRRSVLDPGGEIMVRQTEDRGSITLVVAADLSRSMRPRADSTKLGAVATLLDSASRSTHRAGDRLGFVAFDEGVRTDLAVAPGRGRSRAMDLAARLRRMAPHGRHAGGMAELAAHLPDRRCLILLVSDFLVPPAIVHRAVEALARHDVAPIVLHDAAEAVLPSRGLLRLEDAESGQRRLLWMRPGLRARMEAAKAARWAALEEIFRRHCRAAFHVHGRLEVEALGRHLLGV